MHTAYIAEVKRGLGLPMYDAPNTVEELKHPRPYPTERMGMAEAGSTVEKRALVLTKKGHIALFCLAEGEGFGPPEACTSTVFKTAAFDHSAISPGLFGRLLFGKSVAKIMLFFYFP